MGNMTRDCVSQLLHIVVTHCPYAILRCACHKGAFHRRRKDSGILGSGCGLAEECAE